MYIYLIGIWKNKNVVKDNCCKVDELQQFSCEPRENEVVYSTMHGYRKKKFKSWYFSPGEEPARHSYKLFLCNLYRSPQEEDSGARESIRSQRLFSTLAFIWDKTIVSSAFQRMTKAMLVLFPFLRRIIVGFMIVSDSFSSFLFSL